MKKLLLTFLIAFITALGLNAKDYYTVLFGKDYNSKSVQTYDDSWYVTYNGTRWDLANFNNNQNGWSYVKCGSKKNASVATITSYAALHEKISTVTVTIDKITVESVNSISLTVADDAQFKTNAATYTAANLATGDLPFTIDKPAANKFYKLTFDCKQSSNGVIQVSKFVFSGNDDLPTSCEAPNFNFEENAEVTTGDVIKATCTTDNSTVYLKVGDGEFKQTDSYTITKELATGPLSFEAYATVKGANGIIESDHTSLNVNVVNVKSNVSDDFTLITDAGDLYDGMEMYIVSGTKALSTTQNNNNRGQTEDLTINNGILTPISSAQLITLEATNVTEKPWKFNVGNGYLYAASSSKNYLKTSASPEDNNEKATISIETNGNATITFRGTSERNVLKYNSKDGLFSCYTKGQTEVQIYAKKTMTAVEPGEVTSMPAAVEGVITINKNEEITFSSKDAAKLQVFTQSEPVVVVGSPYKYTPTEEGEVTITPIDSEGKVYTEKAATFTIKFFKGLVDGTISYNTNTFTYTIGSEATLPELVKEPADVDVEYSISHERVENGVAVYNPATIDEQGNITVNTPGIVTVTATVKADRAKTASYVLEIQSRKEAEIASTVKAPVVHITGGNVYYSPEGEWYWGTENENHVLSFANETDGADIYYIESSATPSSANVRAMANSATDKSFKKSDLDGMKITFWAEKDGQKSAVETLNFNIKTGIEDIDVENGEAIEEEGDARYFNLQGLEVKNPGEGIYIRVANGKATKILKK